LTWDVVICPSCISHCDQNINMSNLVFFSIWDDGGDGFGSGNPIIKSIDRF
jgi:oxalate decarboxylase/phosphoglucose isomerase-like protein (cupin superfamily)